MRGICCLIFLRFTTISEAKVHVFFIPSSQLAKGRSGIVAWDAHNVAESHDEETEKNEKRYLRAKERKKNSFFFRFHVFLRTFAP